MSIEEERRYTAEEVTHLVAREVAKQRMADIERAIVEIKSDTAKMWAKFDANFDSLRRSLEGRDDALRKEMERDFASKVDLERIEGKFNALTVRLSTIVATIMAAGTIVNYMINAGSILSK